jgi:hypothetical protein
MRPENSWEGRCKAALFAILPSAGARIMNERDTDWFRPLWRRVAVTAFCAVWAAWEWFYTNDALWKWIALAAAAIAVWTFFVAFDRGGKTPPPNKPPS